MVTVIIREFEPDRIRRERMALRVLKGCPIPRRRGQRMDAGNESISMARNRHDVVVLIGTLMQRSSQGGDLTDEIVFLYGRIRPHQVEQLILADDTVSMLKQHDQDIEGLGRDEDRTVCVP